MSPASSDISDLRQDVRRLEDRHEDLRRDVVLSYVSNRAFIDEREKRDLRLAALDTLVRSHKKESDDYVAAQVVKETEATQRREKSTAHIFTIIGVVSSMLFGGVGAVLGILSYMHTVHP